MKLTKIEDIGKDDSIYELYKSCKEIDYILTWYKTDDELYVVKHNDTIESQPCINPVSALVNLLDKVATQIDY
jgi:hypothetical protein